MNLKAWATKVIKKYPVFGNIYFPHYFSRLSNKHSVIVLLFTMMKTGSATIFESFQKKSSIPIFWHHYLKKNGEYWSLSSTNSYIECLVRYTLNDRTFKIVTLVREPIIRNISDFFHHLDEWYPNFSQQFKRKSLTPEKLVNDFLENYPHDKPLHWFESQLKQLFGIDVYNEPFPQTQGYKIYTGNHPDLLLLKLEMLNDCVQEAFEKFLGIENFTMLKANIARHKAYYPLYQHFLSAKLLPQPYIERMYASKYARHFYTEEELNRFQKNWVPQTTNESEYD